MRIGLAVLLLVGGLSGCIDSDDGPPGSEFPLEVYRFHYDGSDTFVPGVDHGWMLRVSNPSNHTQSVSILTTGVASGVIGPISVTGGAAPQTAWLPGRIESGQTGGGLILQPGASGLFLARIAEYEGDGSREVTARVVAIDQTARPQTASSKTLSWTVDDAPMGTAAAPGDHVQTVTVGVWLNGTSFYSNAAAALTDPTFPHAEGWTSPNDDTTPLPIYVYGSSSDEQPARSQDTCHFTTIAGYNGLIKLQAEGSTNVALLRPEAAYTAAGREDHPLYGDALVFMNTVVAHDGSTTTTDALPDPTGACFTQRVTSLLDGLPPVAA